MVVEFLVVSWVKNRGGDLWLVPDLVVFLAKQFSTCQWCRPGKREYTSARNDFEFGFKKVQCLAVYLNEEKLSQNI